MKSSIIQTLTTNFESHANNTPDGVEFWLARDLQHLLSYSKWDNFQSVISKARTACELSEQEIEDHFADVGKMVVIGVATFLANGCVDAGKIRFCSCLNRLSY